VPCRVTSAGSPWRSRSSPTCSALHPGSTRTLHPAVSHDRRPVITSASSSTWGHTDVVSVPWWLLGRRRDCWPRVVFNSIRSGLQEPRRELQVWGRKPRRSLARTQGVLILWAVLAPFLLIVDGAELILGLVYPASLASHVMGLPLFAAGVLVVYLDVVYLRRPVRAKSDQDRTG
jgi:hypothetical protein